jgi:hypothetical protein
MPDRDPRGWFERAHPGIWLQADHGRAQEEVAQGLRQFVTYRVDDLGAERPAACVK